MNVSIIVSLEALHTRLRHLTPLRGALTRPGSTVMATAGGGEARTERIDSRARGGNVRVSRDRLALGAGRKSSTRLPLSTGPVLMTPGCCRLPRLGGTVDSGWLIDC